MWGTRWEGVRSQPWPHGIPDALPGSSTSTAPTTGPPARHPSGRKRQRAPDRFASYQDYVDFVRSLLPDNIQGPALDAMLRSSVDTLPDGSVVDKHSVAASAPFVQALKAFRHPYSDITAPALAIFAFGDRRQGAEATWRVACRDRFAAETADAHVIELRASHYLFIDRPDDVLAAIRKFLTKPSSGYS